MKSLETVFTRRAVGDNAAAGFVQLGQRNRFGRSVWLCEERLEHYFPDVRGARRITLRLSSRRFRGAVMVRMGAAPGVYSSDGHIHVMGGEEECLVERTWYMFNSIAHHGNVWVKAEAS